MAILSVSRRTDIPTFHSEWFMDKLRQGKVGYRNPFNEHQITMIPLNNEVIDCIVFWTKNAIPMANKIDELNSYNIPYYFQYTITAYDDDMEKNLPNKDMIIDNFIEISNKNNHRMIWRYDPILFNEKYDINFHIENFKRIAERLNGYTKKCVISFVDNYSSIKNNDYTDHTTISKAELFDFCKTICNIAKDNGMEMATCSEHIELYECGIKHNHCIDKAYIEEIIGYKLDVSPDKNQRNTCGCYESIDIGAYDTCKNGCKYCYACKSQKNIDQNFMNKFDESLVLCSNITKFDKITEKKIASNKITQMSLFDFL